MARNDPLRNFRFRLEIDNITVGSGVTELQGGLKRSTIARAPTRPTSASSPR